MEGMLGVFLRSIIDFIVLMVGAFASAIREFVKSIRSMF